jgi:ABC-2 type transport system permease protein
MSALAVARKDFKRARRSRALWTAGTLLAMIAALLVFSYEGYRLSPRQESLQAFRMLKTLLAAVVPIVALVAGYLAVAGERESGGIKFLLGFPNTRRDVVLGKLASRLVVVAVGVTLLFVAAASMSLARHGILPFAGVVGLFVLTLVYGSVFVTFAVALSASVAARSRAIGAAVGSYLILVILNVVPTFSVAGVVRWLHHTMLGQAENPHLYSAVTSISPFTAYRKAANLVFPGRQRVLRAVETGGPDSMAELPFYLTDGFAPVIFAVWMVVPIVLGYLRFRGSDL